MKWQPDWRLMAVVSLSPLASSVWMRRVDALIEGGVTCFQLREKKSLPEETTELAIQLSHFIEGKQVGLIINDTVAQAVQGIAHGVHVGESDISPLAARHLIGEENVLGVTLCSSLSFSAYGEENLRKASPTYYGVGPVYSTPSKPDAPAALGLRMTRELIAKANRPCIAIGGITLERIEDVMATGAHGIAAIAALWEADEPKHAARAFRERIDAIVPRVLS